MKQIVFYIFLFFGCTVHGQVENNAPDQSKTYQAFQDLHYRSQIQNAPVNFVRNKQVHSGIKPMLTTHYGSEDNKEGFQLNYEKYIHKSRINLYPLVYATGGIELSQQNQPLFEAGAGIGFDLSTPKFILTAKALPYYKQAGTNGDSLQSNYDMDFGTNRSLTQNVFYNAELLLAFKANKFFTFSGGYGKNYFGEGYRSMLLSDNMGAHPFFKIETSFSSVKYVNLYSFWKDNTSNPFDRSSDITKLNSTHYLSWNITKDFNFSIFETVVFQMRDSLVNRGFDFNYINPIVFYRPVEYGLGSSDNVLIGTSMSYKVNDHHNIYTQFILDEFLLSEIQKKSRWWANKFGWQIGYKSDAFFTDSLYFQIELNGARPFTYSHKSSHHSYGHLNAAAAHPIGANFLELLQITSYAKGKHRFTNKFVFTSYGVDPTDTISYGTDIFKSYKLRPGDFDQYMFQGVRTNVMNETFIYEYQLFTALDLFITAQYNWRFIYNANGTENFHSFSLGIRSRIWNSYNDY